MAWFLNNLVPTSKLSIVKNDSSERPYVQASLLCNRARTERTKKGENLNCAPSDLPAPAPIHSCAWLLGAGCRAYKETELELNLSLGLGLLYDNWARAISNSIKKQNTPSSLSTNKQHILSHTQHKNGALLLILFIHEQKGAPYSPLACLA